MSTAVSTSDLVPACYFKFKIIFCNYCGNITLNPNGGVDDLSCFQVQKILWDSSRNGMAFHQCVNDNEHRNYLFLRMIFRIPENHNDRFE